MRHEFKMPARHQGRKTWQSWWIEMWLESNPGKTLLVARLTRNTSMVLRRESDDFISVQWLKTSEQGLQSKSIIYDDSWVRKRFMDQ